MPAAWSRSASRAGRLGLRVRDRDHPHLLRREPDRERAGEVLDQDRHEALERAAHGAVDDHRPVLGVVLADVDEVEPLRRGVVELDGAQLPLPADRVGDVEVDLGPVERAVARLELVRLPRGLERRAEVGLGAVPHRVLADPLLRPGGELERGREPEGGVQLEDHVGDPPDLGGDLAARQVDVAVVLLELAHPGEPAERAGDLVPVQHVEGRVAERQLAVAVLPGAEVADGATGSSSA